MKKFLLLLIFTIYGLYVLGLCFPGKEPEDGFVKEVIEPNIIVSTVLYGGLVAAAVVIVYMSLEAYRANSIKKEKENEK